MDTEAALYLQGSIFLKHKKKHTMAQDILKEILNNHRPTLTMDGDNFCLLAGQDLQTGIAGFGESLIECVLDFTINVQKKENEYDTEIDDETMD